MVPAAKACEVGLDRSMIGAYGHDDRVCAYAGLRGRCSICDVRRSYTAVCILADKEEIGSVGVSGMQSRVPSRRFWATCARARACDLRHCLAQCASACRRTSTAAFDPTFADMCDRRNNAAR